MCVLTIKQGKKILPTPAKLCIIVLGNLKDWVWTKSEKFSPVLCADSLRYIVNKAVNNLRLFNQSDCKDRFCNGYLSYDKVAIVGPPNDNPSASKHKFWLLKKTLCGLCCSLRH